ncbi:hypothetical protein [Anaerocolumna sp. MB42-C2]|uniref:hypothetical protein n=1 Tax=Anaerocolumna sp. MB42-C2 TaxID=3070997 RepID=UPI0027E1741D|nr:hypothetical protein [Anaerocolumna sp. MB42-C2]WMJ88084.1 hypothetical protein RBU59_00865 [Anaerocolumna sp. MB42-C2]
MGNKQDEVKFLKKTREDKVIQKQRKDDDKLKRQSRMKEMFQRNKLKKEQKKHIIYLNIIQTGILVVVIYTEILSFYGYVSKVYSIIGLFILCISCIVIMKKIKKKLQL